MQKRIFTLSIAAFLAVIYVAVPAIAQTITPTQDLSFGAFAAGTGGTITISPEGVRSATSDVALMTGGQFSQGSVASFDVSGTPNANYQITLPQDGQVTLTGSQGGNMSVTTFTKSPSGQGQLDSLGTQTVTVGGTLAVGSNQAAGTYSGSFNVTIVYQ